MAKKDFSKIIEDNFFVAGAFWDGDNFYTLNPRREDKNIGSFSISKTGGWFDQATKDGGKLFYINKKWTLCKKIREYNFDFRDEDSNILFSVERKEYENNKKQIKPYYIINDTPINGLPKKYNKKRTLFNLEKLKNHNGPILLVEGEKCCHEKVEKHVPEFLLMTWHGGSSNVNKVDFSPIKNRDVYLWPDNDEPGIKAMRYAAGKLNKTFWIEPIGKKGDDIIDFIKNKNDVMEHIKKAEKVEIEEQKDEVEIPDKQSETILIYELIKKSITRAYYDKKHDKCIVVFPGRKDQLEFSYTQHTAFRRFIVSTIFTNLNRTVGKESINQIIELIESDIAKNSDSKSPSYRVAGNKEIIYLHIWNDEIECIEITANGWGFKKISDIEPIFIKTNGMLPLPIPDKKGKIELLKKYLNIENEEQWYLIIAFIIASLFPPNEAYPGLQVSGEHGSAKTTFCKIIKAIVDPSIAPVRTQPKNDEDAALAATKSHLIIFDNVSNIPTWLSDLLCTFATGGGYAKRTLYKNDEQTILEYQKPVILNGITDFINRADLLDRYIHLYLPAITNGHRKLESELWENFNKDSSLIFGAICNILSQVLKILPEIKIKHYPRMADFSRIGIAVEKVLNWPEGSFLEAYNKNREEGLTIGLESSIFGQAMLYFLCKSEKEPREIKEAERFEFTATELLNHLSIIIDEKTKRSKYWPSTPKSLSNNLNRFLPNLRALGFNIEYKRTKEARKYVFSNSKNDKIKIASYTLIEEEF